MVKKELPSEVLDQLLKDWGGPAGLLGDQGLLKQLTAALVQRAMDAELSHHVGYERGETPPDNQTNRRNGKSKKRVRTEHGSMEVSVPRDREGTFSPEILPKHQRHFNGFDDKILSMYARGMSTRDIRAHLEEIYGVEVSPELISHVTDAVVDELRGWQNRPLDTTYLIVYLDALVAKIRDKGVVKNKSVYTAVGVGADGKKQVLGLWVQQTEGAKFWLSILQALRQRGTEDIFILCADGLTGLSEAVEATFPQTIFQTCIVHMIRSSTRFVPWKERRAVCADLRKVYTATDEETASDELDAFEKIWGERFPMIAAAWRRRWEEVTPFLAFPAEIRRAVYTTNAIEALNRHTRKSLKTRGHMPSDEAAIKLIYLAIKTAKTWMRPPPYWPKAALQFAIHFEERMPR
jgi:putative transposase